MKVAAHEVLVGHVPLSILLHCSVLCVCVLGGGGDVVVGGKCVCGGRCVCVWGRCGVWGEMCVQVEMCVWEVCGGNVCCKLAFTQECAPTCNGRNNFQLHSRSSQNLPKMSTEMQNDTTF